MFFKQNRQLIINNIRKMSSNNGILTNSGTTWYKPECKAGEDYPKLKLFNSLTRSKTEFVSNEPGKITWYSCGPTVYNHSHMGHARNYVSIDINRRILEKFFNYDIKFIQNVTDIDDKIIIKARQEHLFKEFIAKYDEKITTELVEYSKKCTLEFIKANLKDFNGETFEEYKSWVATLDLKTIGLEKPKIPMYVKSANNAINVVENTISFQDFIENVKDVIVPVLDQELGSTVTDPNIFKECSSYWERQYDLDMQKLNVLKPTVITRVSEYVPEIVKFVETIIQQGYAYATVDGSVYFNTSKFDNSENHEYAKCQPWSKGDMELLNDGEGSLTKIENKLNSSDFALWKSSKAGEPFWESPWGNGRPGWHIECSVMASDFIGSNMDIHSGGIDLAFPHHDNEMAQSEACYDCKQWVNYFLHTGHLHIEGQKMSKSLKNFITIEEALKMYSARQLRLIFSLVSWNNPLDFKESLLNECRSAESTFDKFFAKIRALNNDYEDKLNSGEVISKKFGEKEKKLLQEWENTKFEVYKSLCDNLNTPLAVRNLLDLINLCNSYITEVGVDIRIELLTEIVKYITKILEVFGFETREDKLGWKESSIKDSLSSESASKNVEDIAMPFVKVLSKFRDLVRAKSIAGGNDFKELLIACDKVRDEELIKLGVALDDRNEGQSALVKFLNESEKEELLKQQREKEEMMALKLKKKEEQARQAAIKEKERLEKSKISPLDMFKVSEHKGKYLEWDAEGLPTKDAAGEEVSKSARKKLAKQQQQQKKLHDEYLKSVSAN